MALIFVDCEGINVVDGRMTEFGAVEYKSRETFHGITRVSDTMGQNDFQIKGRYKKIYDENAIKVFEDFKEWLARFSGRPIFVSDNPAYDWQGINYHFLKYLGSNPFGHSARRIGDFYAGLKEDFYTRSKWKNLRRTPHDHNPVNDAMGNVEAFESLMEGKLP